MAGTSKSAEEEELINEIAAEQQVLCEQAKEYRKCSLAERIAQATAYRNKQLRRWDERGLPLLQFLVSSGPAKTTRVKFDGSYSLIDASSRDDVEEVQMLLEDGADANAVNFDGLSALHQCCIEDSPEIAQLLIDYGADVNLRDNEWWTPLHAASSCGLDHIVELLLDNGACVAVLNSDGDLPIDMADTSQIYDMLKDAQMKQGFSDEDISYQRYELEEKMTTDLKNGVLKATDRDRVQATPLHVAAAHGLDRVSELLLQQGADVNAKDMDDWTPAHAASCWGHASVLTILSNHGADFDARTKNYDTPYSLTEDTELQEVIMDLKLKAVEKLSSRRANRGKRMTISSRGHSVKRSTLERKKSLSKHEAKNEAMQRRRAQEQIENEVDAAPSNTDITSEPVVAVQAENPAPLQSSGSQGSKNGPAVPEEQDRIGSLPTVRRESTTQANESLDHHQSTARLVPGSDGDGDGDEQIAVSPAAQAEKPDKKGKSCCTIL